MRSVLLAAAAAAACVGQARAAEDPACAFWSQLLSDQAAPFVKYRAGKLDAAGIAKGVLAPSKAFACEYQAEDAANAAVYPRTYVCTATASVQEAVLKEYQQALTEVSACFPGIKFDEQTATEFGLSKTSTAKQAPFSIVIEAAFDKKALQAGRPPGKLTLSAAWKPSANTAP